MKKVRVGVLSPARTFFVPNMLPACIRCRPASAAGGLTASAVAASTVVASAVSAGSFTASTTSVSQNYIGMAMTAMPMITRTAAETASM